MRVILQSVKSRWKNQLTIATVSIIDIVCIRWQCYRTQITWKLLIPLLQKQKVGIANNLCNFSGNTPLKISKCLPITNIIFRLLIPSEALWMIRFNRVDRPIKYRITDLSVVMWRTLSSNERSLLPNWIHEMGFPMRGSIVRLCTNRLSGWHLTSELRSKNRFTWKGLNGEVSGQNSRERGHTGNMNYMN